MTTRTRSYASPSSTDENVRRTQSLGSSSTKNPVATASPSDLNSIGRSVISRLINLVNATFERLRTELILNIAFKLSRRVAERDTLKLGRRHGRPEANPKHSAAKARPAYRAIAVLRTSRRHAPPAGQLAGARSIAAPALSFGGRT